MLDKSLWRQKKKQQRQLEIKYLVMAIRKNSDGELNSVFVDS